MKPILRLVIMIFGLVGGGGAQALQDFDGQARELADYVGQGDQWLVVMLWESNCPACNRVVHRYVDFHEFNTDQRAHVLGISMDGPRFQAGAEDFIRRHQVQFPNLIAEPGEVILLYQSLTGDQFLGTPSFLVFDPSGTLRAKQVGPLPTEVLQDYIDKADREAMAAP